ncbi:MAG: hypothetical protein GAK29_03291 [Acinetobacter bereziniae]|uniref:Uncharacterized protein n=1 Tax=Acinetobacter bereziniae TaxID=106648 RepID=A0A833PCU8_ACIBZ|nr:MAG: hypothetical protein GAK29_03291 [Acinetobacter bereziniae]
MDAFLFAITFITYKKWLAEANHLKPLLFLGKIALILEAITHT